MHFTDRNVGHVDGLPPPHSICWTSPGTKAAKASLLSLWLMATNHASAAWTGVLAFADVRTAVSDAPVVGGTPPQAATASAQAIDMAMVPARLTMAEVEHNRAGRGVHMKHSICVAR